MVEEKKTFHIPDWVRDGAMKIVPWAIMALIAGAVGLFADNIGNKRDIARNAWRADQADVRANRQEIRMDRLEEALNELKDTQEEFQGEALHRLDILLEKQERQRRQRER